MIIVQVTPQELERMIYEACDKVISRYMGAISDEPLTAKQVARLLGKSTSTVHRMKKRGAITPLTPHGRHTFSKREIMTINNSKKI